jgi:hypothetical protein
MRQGRSIALLSTLLSGACATGPVDMQGMTRFEDCEAAHERAGWTRVQH